MKKILSTVLVIALMVSLLAACGTKKSDSSDASTTKATATEKTTEAPKKIVELSAMLYLNPEIELKDNPVVAEIEKRLGIRLNIEAPSLNDFWERQKMVMAAGEAPDLWISGSGIESTQYAQQGLCADVTDLVKDYPNLMANIDAQHWKDTEFFNDGKIYGVTRAGAENQFGYLINKKWLDKLGLQPPKTVAEFVDVCRKFTFNDPDGNGKNDTYGVGLGAAGNGVSGNAIWAVNSEFITAPFGCSWFLSIPNKDGKFDIRPFTDNYIPYLKLMRDMYKEGILDREFITQKVQEAEVEKYAQGRVGIVGVNGSNYPTTVIEKYGLNPADHIFRPALALDDSHNPIYMQEPVSWFAFYMSAKSDKIKDSLRLLDWGNSKEGFELMNLGIQGVHYDSYDFDNRTIVRSEDQIKALSKVTSNFFSFAIGMGGRLPVEGGSTPEMISAWQKDTKAANEMSDKYKIVPTKILNQLNIDLPDDVVTLGTLEARYVTGQIELSEIEKFLKDYRTKTQKYTDEYNTFRQANPFEIVKATK